MAVPVYLRVPPYTDADHAAIQALAAGTANERQQQRVLEWIINTAANTYDLSFDPASERGTAFAEGRRFVGLQLVKLIKLDRRIFNEGTENG